MAIELAEQYIAAGNYSRAEYTLTRAIADGGSLELYIALCRSYVAQDKLMDAVAFLNKVSDPHIRSQLDDLRPAVPTVSPDPGFYNQYFSVSVTAETGTLYVSTDREYPSTKEDQYTAPLPLAAGENTIYALTVASNGLVSDLAVYGYTLGGVIEEVTFTDPAMEAEIRKLLGVTADVVLFTNDLWDIRSFTVPAEAKTYSDLKYLPYLTSLTIHKGLSGQLSSLSALESLLTLEITDTPVETQELAFIGSLPKLKSLTLNGCGLSSIDALSSATTITELNLNNNAIRDISAIASMTGLKKLYLQRNAVNDLSQLSALTGLTELDVSYNSISKLDPVGGLSSLSHLNAAGNTIASLPSMEALKALSYLDLSSNALTDAAPIAACTSLTYLNLSSNALTNISAFSPLTKLTELNFSYNQVTELPNFSKSCALVTIDGSYNALSKLDNLSGLNALNNVYMDYNKNISSVSALAKCPVLIQVHVFGTKVKDVSALTSQSIIVHYDPT